MLGPLCIELDRTSLVGYQQTPGGSSTPVDMEFPASGAFLPTSTEKQRGAFKPFAITSGVLAIKTARSLVIWSVL